MPLQLLAYDFMPNEMSNAIYPTFRFESLIPKNIMPFNFSNFRATVMPRRTIGNKGNTTERLRK